LLNLIFVFADIENSIRNPHTSGRGRIFLLSTSRVTYRNQDHLLDLGPARYWALPPRSVMNRQVRQLIDGTPHSLANTSVLLQFFRHLRLTHSVCPSVLLSVCLSVCLSPFVYFDDGYMFDRMSWPVDSSPQNQGIFRISKIGVLTNPLPSPSFHSPPSPFLHSLRSKPLKSS